MAEYETAAHQVAADQRHAAARNAANILTKVAGSVVAAGHDVTHVDTVVGLGQGEVAEQVANMAPCGCVEDVLAAAVMLISELSLQLGAAHQGGAR